LCVKRLYPSSLDVCPSTIAPQPSGKESLKTPQIPSKVSSQRNSPAFNGSL